MTITLAHSWQTVPEIVAANGGKLQHQAVIAALHVMLAKREVIGGTIKVAGWQVPVFCRAYHWEKMEGGAA